MDIDIDYIRNRVVADLLLTHCPFILDPRIIILTPVSPRIFSPDTYRLM